MLSLDSLHQLVPEFKTYAHCKDALLNFNSTYLRTLLACFNLIVFTGYLIFLRLFNFIRSEIIWRIFDLHRIPSVFPVRLYSIRYRHKRDFEEAAWHTDFVLTHEAFASLRILASPFWTLYSIDQEKCYFVQLPEPMPHYHIKRYPFMYVALFEQAKCLAEISHANFLQLNEIISKRPMPPTVFLTHTGRCGSTLFGQMLHHDDVSLVYGEPYPLRLLAIGYNEGYFNQQDLQLLIGPVIDYLRKDVPSNRICVLKTACFDASLVPFTKQLNMKHVFMSRRDGLNSVERMLLRDPMMTLFLRLYNLSPTVNNWLSWMGAYEGVLKRGFKPNNMKEWAALVYAAPYQHYLKNQPLYCLPIVWHHEIIHKTHLVLPDIFKELNIPQSCLETAVECLNRDSQGGSFPGRAQMQVVQASPLTPETAQRLVKLAEFTGLPREFMLQG